MLLHTKPFYKHQDRSSNPWPFLSSEVLFLIPIHGSATVKYHPLVNNAVPLQQSHAVHRLSDQLSDTTRLLDLLLSIPAEVSGANNDGDLGDAALAQDLGVAEGEEVDDGGGVSLLAAQVGFTLLGWDERPQLDRPVSENSSTSSVFQM